MKVSLNRQDFLQAARRLSKVAPQASSTACLTGILLEADAENLEVTMTATNLEMSISCTLPAAVMISGSVVVNATLFTDMLRLFGEATVLMEVLPNQQIHLTSGHASYSIATLSSADYPKMKVSSINHTTEITNLHSLVKSTAFAVSKDATNPTLKCVKLEISDGNARAVSTDGMRLMTCTKALPEDSIPLTLLIPSSAFSLLASLVRDDEKLRLQSSDRVAVFENDVMTFTTLLGTGSYIDVDSVLSSITGCYEALVDAKELSSALDLLDAVATGSDQLHMVFTLGSISLSCTNDHAVCHAQAVAQILIPMPPEGFYYPLRSFSQCISAMSGMLKLSVSSNGFLMVESGAQTFMHSPARPRTKTLEKPKAEKATKPKGKTTKKAAPKAA